MSGTRRYRHGSSCIPSQWRPDISIVTAIAAAYWAHSPVVFITPETGSTTMGLGGFQETEQLPIFSNITKYQGCVSSPKRMAEIAARCFDRAMLEMGPCQLNIPRDHFYGDIQATINPPMRIGRGPGDAAALDEAATLLAAANKPFAPPRLLPADLRQPSFPHPRGHARGRAIRAAMPAARVPRSGPLSGDSGPAADPARARHDGAGAAANLGT